MGVSITGIGIAIGVVVVVVWTVTGVVVVVRVVVDFAFEVAQEHDDTNIRAVIKMIITANQSIFFLFI